MKIRHLFCIAATSLALSVGCSHQKPEPQIASSANQAGYAESYPDQLQATLTQFSDREREARAVLQELPKYPDQLKNPSWNHVLKVVEKADEAGRSQAYVDREREVSSVHTFFEAEKTEIGRKVGGTAQYMAQQKGCKVELQGAVTHALEESVAKQSEKRLRQNNEAHLFIERYRQELGKDNAAALETQADQISYASYLTHIQLVEIRVRTTQMLQEADQVKHTADQFISDEKAYQAEPGRTDADKKASQERIEAMNRAKAQVDTVVQQSKSVVDIMKKQTAALQDDYNKALASYKDGLRQKASQK